MLKNFTLYLLYNIQNDQDKNFLKERTDSFVADIKTKESTDDCIDTHLPKLLEHLLCTFIHKQCDLTYYNTYSKILISDELDIHSFLTKFNNVNSKYFEKKLCFVLKNIDLNTYSISSNKGNAFAKAFFKRLDQYSSDESTESSDSTESENENSEESETSGSDTSKNSEFSNKSINKNKIFVENLVNNKPA
jgi:hypothetical protein